MAVRNTMLFVLPLQTDLGREIFRGAQEVIAHQNPPLRWRLIEATTEYVRYSLINPELKAALAGVIAFVFEPEMENLLAACGRPVINVSARLPHVRVPTVVSDNDRVGRLAAEHLLGCGLANFVFVGSETRFSEERYQGFAAGLAAVGRQCLRCLPQRAALRRTLRRIARPCGVFCASDSYCVSLLELAAEMHWSVPEDLAVLGCDNETLVCATAPVPLSSIDLNGRGIGALAAETLLDLIAGRPVPPGTLRVQPAGIVPRASTEVVAVANQQLSAALAVIRARACEPLAVNDLSSAVHMSRRTLERLFRRQLRRSVRAEILRARLHRACQLLRDTDQSIGEISRAAGFANYGRFTRVFRTVHRTTPTLYRRRFRRA